MTDVTSRLRLVVDSSGVDRAGRRLRDVREEARQLDAMAAKLRNSFAGLAAIVGVAFSAEGIIKFGDAWTRVTNQLKTVEKSMASVKAAQQGIFEIGQRTFTAFDSTAALYTKLQRSSAGLIKSQQEALRITETVNKLMAVGGASTNERNSAVLQLGQALGSGRLQGDEFRSISENAPLIMEALAASTGRARGELKQLGSDGKITSEVLIKALKDFSDEADAAFENFTPSVADAWTNLTSAFERLVGERGSGIFNALAAAIQTVATNLDLIAKLATVAGAALATAFVGKGIGGLTATISQMMALERALGATSAAAALQGVVVKGLQQAWRAFTVAMASNPFGLIAVAITATLVALYEFGDRIKIETGTFTSSMDEMKGKTLEYEVTVRDFMAAIPSLIGDGLSAVVQGFSGWIEGLFGTEQMVQITIFFTQVLETAKAYFNLFVSVQVAALGALVKNWGKLPQIFVEIFKLAVQAALTPVEWFVNKIIEALNGLISRGNEAAKALGLPFQVPTLGMLEFADATVKAGSALGNFGKDFTSILETANNTDWVGTIGTGFQAVTKVITDRAREMAKKRAEAEAAALKGGLSPAAPATAAAAEEMSKEQKRLLEQMSEYQKMFSEAAKLRDAALISDDEVEIVDRTLSLLDRFPEIYKQMGIYAQVVARTDAERLITMEKQAKAASELRKLRKEINLPNQRAAALAAGGPNELDIFDKVQKIIESGALDFDQNGMKRTAAEAAKLAREMAKAQIAGEKLDAATNRLRDRLEYLSTEMINERLGQDLEYVFDRFFDDLPTKGGEAFKDLFANLGSVFNQALSDALKAAVEPFVSQIRDSLKKAMSDVIGSLGKDGKAGTGIMGALQGFGEKIFGKEGLAKISSAVSTGVQVFAATQVGGQISSMLGGNKTGAQQKNSMLGGLAGGGAGYLLAGLFSVTGPVGAVIGALAGSILGGLLGPSSTNAAASSILDATGKSTSGVLGTKRTEETTSALSAAISALQAGYSAIADLGGSITTYVRNLEIGQRDKSRVDLSNGSTVFTAVGDAEAAANAGLIAVLKGTTFANETLNKLKDGMIAAGMSFDDAYTALAKVNQILEATQPAMTEWAKALADFQKTLTGDALKVATEALGGAFAKSVAQQRLELENPAGAQAKAVGESVAALIKDAQAFGVAIGEGSDVFAVATRQISDVFTDAFKDVTSAEQLTKAISDLKKTLQDAGVSAEYASKAIEAAMKTTRDAFNEDILSQIQGYLTDPLDQLNALLKAQAARLEEAKAKGADIANVERLTALELRDFFQGLSDDALSEVEGFLGLFDDATNAVVRNLDLSRQDLEGQRDAFQQFAQDFAQLRTDLTQQYLVASPRESIDGLRGRVEELLKGVAAGNQSAGTALPQVVQQLVEAARATYGNTGAFSDILAYAQNALTQGEAAAKAVMSDAEKQIAALDANNDILSDIRDILQSSQATNAFFQSYLSGGVASSDALLALIQQGTGASASNANASALNITGLIAQSVQPIITPLVTSIGTFTDRLSELPSLQRRTIEAVDRSADRIVAAIDAVNARLDRLESLEKKQLEELEQANVRVA